MALTSAVLVFRTMLEIWRIQLDTLLESSIITMDSKRFNRNLLKFFMLMPSVSNIHLYPKTRNTLHF